MPPEEVDVDPADGSQNENHIASESEPHEIETNEVNHSITTDDPSEFGSGIGYTPLLDLNLLNSRVTTMNPDSSYGNSTLFAYRSLPDNPDDSDDFDNDKATDENEVSWEMNTTSYQETQFTPTVNFTEASESSDEKIIQEPKANDYDTIAKSILSSNWVDFNSTSSHFSFDVENDSDRIASQALSALENDYMRSLSRISKSSEVHDIDTKIMNSTFSHDGNNDGIEASGPDSFLHMMSSSTCLEKDSTVLLKHSSPNNDATDFDINVDAVKSAMKKINLKSSFALNKWEKIQQSHDISKSPNFSHDTSDSINIKTHPFIPSSTLNFFNSTLSENISAGARAKYTSEFSRPCTIAESIHRVMDDFSLKTSQTLPQTLHIHIIGADHVECKNEETIRKCVSPFLRWFSSSRVNNKKENYDLNMIQKIKFSFLGPNVPVPDGFKERNIATLEKPLNLLPVSKTSVTSQRENATSLKEASVVCHNCLYHEYIDSFYKPDTDSYEDEQDEFENLLLIVAFNAGIWGYKDWKPTLQKMGSTFPKIRKYRSYFVVTSYTEQEAEEDAEVLKECFSMNSHERTDDVCTTSVKPLWEIEKNPFGSQLERQTYTKPPEDVVYYENNAWQAFVLG